MLFDALKKCENARPAEGVESSGVFVATQRASAHATTLTGTLVAAVIAVAAIAGGSDDR